MIEKFYVASGFNNVSIVRLVSNQLKNRGYIQTYDWTRNERASSFEELEQVGQDERKAVIDADFIIVILPAGKGSHIELGIALGQGKKIYVYSPNDEINNFETTSTFYHLPEVQKCIGTIEELLELF